LQEVLGGLLVLTHTVYAVLISLRLF